MPIDLDSEEGAGAGLSEFGSLAYLAADPVYERALLGLGYNPAQALVSRYRQAVAVRQQQAAQRIVPALPRPAPSVIRRALPRPAVPQLPALPRPALPLPGPVANIQQLPGVQALISKYGPEKGKQLLQTFTQKHGVQALQKLLPNAKLPAGVNPTAAVDLLFGGKKITAGRVAQAGWVTGKGAAEEIIKTKTGIPISLPKKLTAKEISKSLTSLIPRNLEDAINTGIAIGTQYAASAVGALVAGSAIGSVIPGIGTVVGLGVALAINAFKESLAKLFKEVKPYQRKCPTPVFCPETPKNLSPIELLPWVAKWRAQVALTIAKDQQKRMCGTGSGPECYSRLYWLEGQIFRIIHPKLGGRRYLDSTVAVIGLPLVNKLIAAYSKAPQSYAHYVTRPGTKGYKTIIYEPNNVALVLSWLQTRKRVLEELVARGRNVATLQNLPKYRWDLATEIKNAMIQYSLNESPETTQWITTLGNLWQAMLNREQGEQAARVKEYERQKQLVKDPEIARKLKEANKYLT